MDPVEKRVEKVVFFINIPTLDPQWRMLVNIDFDFSHSLLSAVADIGEL